MTTKVDAQTQEVFRVKSILLDADWQFDDDGNKITRIAECGTCGRKWNDARISSLTPAPSGHCPYEYAHETNTDTARAQAEAQLQHIRELLEWQSHANKCDKHDADSACEFGNYTSREFVGQITGNMTDYRIATHDTDTATQAIHELPLSVMVRSEWFSVGLHRNEIRIAEFEILLCTGGPAVRITGTLNQHGEPETARLEYQDWGTPWTEYVEYLKPADPALLRFSNQFYFGG